VTASTFLTEKAIYIIVLTSGLFFNCVIGNMLNFPLIYAVHSIYGPIAIEC